MYIRGIEIWSPLHLTKLLSDITENWKNEFETPDIPFPIYNYNNYEALINLQMNMKRFYLTTHYFNITFPLKKKLRESNNE